MNGRKKCLNMSPPLGAASVGSGHPPFSKTRSISANYAPFSTKFSGICILTRWSWIREKDAEKCHPPGAPHPVSWNTANYLSLAITNECRWNFQELVYWLGQDKRVKKILKYVTPAWGSPSSPNAPPKYRTRDISANYEQIYTQFPGIIPLTW